MADKRDKVVDNRNLFGQMRKGESVSLDNFDVTNTYPWDEELNLDERMSELHNLSDEVRKEQSIDAVPSKVKRKVNYAGFEGMDSDDYVNIIRSDRDMYRDDLVEDISKYVEEIYQDTPSIKSKDMSVSDKISLRHAVGQAVGDFPAVANGNINSSMTLPNTKAGRVFGKKLLNKALVNVLKKVPMIGSVVGLGTAAMSGDANAMSDAVVDEASGIVGGAGSIGVGGIDEEKRMAIEDPKSFEDLRAIRERLLKGKE